MCTCRTTMDRTPRAVRAVGLRVERACAPPPRARPCVAPWRARQTAAVCPALFCHPSAACSSVCPTFAPAYGSCGALPLTPLACADGRGGATSAPCRMGRTARAVRTVGLRVVRECAPPLARPCAAPKARGRPLPCTPRSSAARLPPNIARHTDCHTHAVPPSTQPCEKRCMPVAPPFAHIPPLRTQGGALEINNGHISIVSTIFKGNTASV